MGLQEDFYPESRFGGFTDIDGTLAFFWRVRALLGPDSQVLDVGCGRGAYGEHPNPTIRDARILKGHCGRIVGIDVDPAAAGNPFIDAFERMEGDRWPVPDAAFDLAVAVDVLEHVADPEGFFSEARRVLKPGGTLCLRTTNAWSYVALAARLVPNRRHAAVLSKVERRGGKKPEDVFPTLYRCNNVFRLRRTLELHGFAEHAVKGFDSEPNYLSFSRFAYALGVLHQRFAPGFLRPALFAFARLPGGEPGVDAAGRELSCAP